MVRQLTPRRLERRFATARVIGSSPRERIAFEARSKCCRRASSNFSRAPAAPFLTGRDFEACLPAATASIQKFARDRASLFVQTATRFQTLRSNLTERRPRTTGQCRRFGAPKPAWILTGSVISQCQIIRSQCHFIRSSTQGLSDGSRNAVDGSRKGLIKDDIRAR
jgi:hypothetical protein